MMKNMERPIPAPRVFLRCKHCKPPVPERHYDSINVVDSCKEIIETSSDVQPSTSLEPPLIALPSNRSVTPPPIPQKPLRLSACQSDCPSSASTSPRSSAFSPQSPQRSCETLSPTNESFSPCSSLISDGNCCLPKPPPIPARKKASLSPLQRNSMNSSTGDQIPVSSVKTTNGNDRGCFFAEPHVDGFSLGIQSCAAGQIGELFAEVSVSDEMLKEVSHTEKNSLSPRIDQAGYDVSINGSPTFANLYPNSVDDSHVRQSVNLIDLSDNVTFQNTTIIEHEKKFDVTADAFQNGCITNGTSNTLSGVTPVQNTQSLVRANLHAFPPSKPLREPEIALDLIEGYTSKNELDVEDGIWNPRYIGLEEYRKLAEISNPILMDFNNENYSLPSSVHLSEEEPLSKRESLDVASCTERSATSSSIDGECICFSGYVHLMVHKKDRGNLWAVLRSNKLSFFRGEDEEENIILGPYDLSNAVYVGRSPKNMSEVNLYIKENSISVHWNHLVMTSDLAQHWVLLIAKCFMPKNDLLNHSFGSLDAGGIVWIRQGATCPWSVGWLHLDQRRLIYALESCTTLFELDVRKIIAMKNEVAKVDWCASVLGAQKGPFLLTREGCSLYVQADNDAITSLWAELLTWEMGKVSNKLEDHKLTGDDVPIIVDKCVKFISTYGLYQRGLYRRNGSTVEARLLMEELKKDPVNVHITPGYEDMVNVVADVLRTFFRQLEAPLIPDYIQERLFAINKISGPAKLSEYHEVLMSLPRIRLQTLRRVLSHLKDVTEHAHANLATVENIAKIFGPTLFSVDQGEPTECGSFFKTVLQVNVLKDLLVHYAVIFRISVREMHARSKMDLLQSKANTAKARADGFLVPVHLVEKDSHTFNVQSSLTAEQVCEAARNRPSFCDDGSGTNFALFEVVKSGQLERRVGWKEKMSSMVAGRWLDWDPTDCYLIFKRDLLPFSFDRLSAFAEDVKVAEPGSKSFCTCHFKLETGTTVIQYNKSMKQVNEWHVDDVLWFNEHETSRKPPYPYTLTFIVLKKNFKYKSKFIGYCVAFRENMSRMQWLNAVLGSQQNFQPEPSY